MHGSSSPTPKRDIICAIAVVVVAGCGLSLMTAIIAIRLHQAGFSGRAIGFNTAASGIATLVSAPFLPSLARRIGIMETLVVSLAVSAIVTALFSLTDNYAAWLALRFIQGLCATALFVLSEFWITTAAGSRRRGLVIGLYVASLAGGFALGPTIAAAADKGSALPFLIGAALFAAAAIPLLANRRSAPAIADRARFALLGLARQHPTIFLAAVLHGAIEIGGMALLPVVALVNGEGAGRGAFYVAMLVIGNSLLQLPIAALADRFNRERLLIVLALCGFAGALLLSPSTRLPQFAVLLAFWGGIVGAFYPVGLGEISRRYEDGALASANSLFVMAYALGILVGPPVIGFGFDMAPPQGMFVAMAGLLGLYGVTTALLLTRGSGQLAKPSPP